MKNLFFFLSVLMLWQASYAQQGNGGSGHYFPEAGWKSIPLITYPSPDVDALREEDLLLDEQGEQPWRFGFNHPTQINSSAHDTWIQAKNGDLIWLVRMFFGRSNSQN